MTNCVRRFLESRKKQVKGRYRCLKQKRARKAKRLSNRKIDGNKQGEK